MLKDSHSNIAFVLTIFSLLSVSQITQAETIINNYQSTPQTQQQPMAQQPMNNQGSTYSTATPPGTYQTRNHDGSYNTVYTTGDKQPYIVDNPAPQQQPIIQPYVYPQNNMGGNQNRPG